MAPAWCVWLCAVTVANSQDSDLGQVVFSHILFRHGERMPLEFYPNDPYKDSSNWPFEIAQLTDDGRRQEFELGQWLRKRYSGLVGPRYSPSEVYVQSTDVDRTIMSAQVCIAGFYGPTDSEDPALAWPSVPIHTVPAKDDQVLGATATCICPAYNSEKERMYTLPEIKELQDTYRYLYNYASNHSGTQVRNFDDAIKIYDTLAIEEKYNMSLPSWSHYIYPEPVREVGLFSFVLPTSTTLLKRLKIGPLLKEIVEHFTSKKAGTLSPDRKLWFYSAHDATISALLNSLDAFDIHFPPYAACVLLELRLIENKHFVTLVYHNSTRETRILQIMSCAKLCPLDQFVSLVNPLIPDDWVQECQLPQNQYFWIITMALAAAVVCALLLTCTLFCWRRVQARNYAIMCTPTLSTASKSNSELADSNLALPK